MIKLVWLVLVTALATLWRRVRKGPRLPSWGVGLEIAVDALRRVVAEMNTWPPARMQEAAGRARRTSVDRRVERSASSPGGVPCERTVARGAEEGPVLFYIHGGGFVLGSPQGHREITTHLALEAGATVVAPDYRLAPQHPFPAALDDVLAGYRGLLDAGIPPEHLVVGGDSAGGVLTLALLQTLREAALPFPAAAVAICPAPDLRLPGESWIRNADTDYLSLAVARQWIGMYTTPDRLDDPLVSTLHGEFAGFPPLLVQAGEAECLYDDIASLVGALEKAGVDVTFESHPEMPHVWHLLRALTPQGDAAIRSIAEFIRARATGA